MNKLINGFILLLLLAGLMACNKKDDQYYNYKPEIKEFPGTALDYLEAQAGVYDSMLAVIDRIPGLADTISGSNITVFAVGNKSFEIAFQALNNNRKQQNLPLVPSINDLNLPDLDTMMCKYIIRGHYMTDEFVGYPDGVFAFGVKYNYQMNVQHKVKDASGFVGGGEQELVFSDTNNSIYLRYWQRTNTQAVNILTSNAVIHPLATGHDFGFAKFSLIFNK